MWQEDKPAADTAVPNPPPQVRRIPRAVRIGGLIIAGLVVGGLATGIASASIPASNGVIHACYSTTRNPVGRLRVIDTDAGQSCTAGEVALTWNQSAFNFRGDWSASGSYAVGDVVTNAGSSYLALVANAGTRPSGTPRRGQFWPRRGRRDLRGRKVSKGREGRKVSKVRKVSKGRKAQPAPPTCNCSFPMAACHSRSRPSTASLCR